MDVMDSVYALGDATDIKGASLPTTAEVACQKAEYLDRALNDGFREQFQYSQGAIVAYIGQHDGVEAGTKDWSGKSAWSVCRSKNLLWARSIRTRVLITVSWALNFVFGNTLRERNYRHNPRKIEVSPSE